MAVAKGHLPKPRVTLKEREYWVNEEGEGVGNVLKTTPFTLTLNVTSTIFTPDLYWKWMEK